MDIAALFIGFHPDDVFGRLISVDAAELVIVFGTIAISWASWWPSETGGPAEQEDFGMAVGDRPRTERPKGPGVLGVIADKVFHNYVWQSIFRSGYPNTPRNQMLAVATNVFLHLHPT